MATNDQNTVVVLGRITKEVEMKQAGQSTVANFSIANNRVYAVNGTKKEETNFFDCEVWGKLAEILKQYGTKGKQVLVTGKLQQKKWQDAENKQHYKIIIRVDNLQLLGGKPSTETGNNSKEEEIPEMPVEEGVF